MDEKRRQALRVSYLKLTRDYRRIAAPFDCGVELAEYLDPKLAELGRAIREIEAEVRDAIRTEQELEAQPDGRYYPECPDCAVTLAPGAVHAEGCEWSARVGRTWPWPPDAEKL